MSGTSLDSIDAALVQLNNGTCNLIESIEHEIPPKLRQQLIDLCQPGANEIDLMGEADRQMGEEFSTAVSLLLDKSGKKANDIVAIGSHGQTIRHRPSNQHPFTLQIGDPNIIVYNTNITTVADFRRRDMAAGGQGAPLAPAFHRAMFSSTSYNRAIINIGGISNITYLGRSGDYVGYDTGPGNTLLDAWINENLQQKYDRNGQWARSGQAISGLLEELLKHPYFSKDSPKSTGREDFNISWLQSILMDPTLTNENYNPSDVQSTLLELTARSIVHEIDKLPTNIDEVYICGGGAYNTELMQRIQDLADPAPVKNTSHLGIAAEWVEAAAFAWLAKQTINGKTGNLTQATGAKREVILGAIYPHGQ